METLKEGISSGASDPVEGAPGGEGREVSGERRGRSGIGVSGVRGVRGGVSVYADCVNTEVGGGRKSAGLVVHRGDKAGGVWFECRRVRCDGDCGGTDTCGLMQEPDWVGVIGIVAERVGWMRIWRRGRVRCCSLGYERFGALGRLPGSLG